MTQHFSLHAILSMVHLQNVAANNVADGATNNGVFTFGSDSCASGGFPPPAYG